jgi:small subunit ribosomal protein S9
MSSSEIVPERTPVRRMPKRANDGRYYATGRRKRATARVFLKAGSGVISVNGRAFEEYFPVASSQLIVQQPLAAVECVGRFDLYITVCGGGPAGQAGAVRHGIARALEQFDPSYRPTLKKAGFLTRDAREKERKKYGQRGARARFQYSKR